MFSLAPVTFSHTERTGAGLWLGEVGAVLAVVAVAVLYPRPLAVTAETAAVDPVARTPTRSPR